MLVPITLEQNRIVMMNPAYVVTVDRQTSNAMGKPWCVITVTTGREYTAAGTVEDVTGKLNNPAQ